MTYARISITLLMLCHCFFSFSQWRWLNPTPSGITSSKIVFSSTLDGLIMYGNGDLVKTNDQGATWNLQQNFAGAFVLDVKDSTGIICGSGVVYISTDKGKSWLRKQLNFYDNLFKADVVSRDTIFMAGNNGKVYRSDDRGDTWKTFTCGITISSMEFINSKVGYIGGTSQYILKTQDGGQTWQQNVSVNTFPSNTMTIKFFDLNTGFAFREHSDLLKTIDGGQSWTKYNMGDDIYSFHFVDTSNIFACGENGVAYRTNNGGNTWTWIGSSARIYLYDLYSTFFFNSDTGFTVGARGRILKTTNGGTSWSTYSPHYLPITDIIPASKSVLYTTVGNMLYKKSDSGANWQKLPLTVGTNYAEYDVFKFGFFKDADTGIVTATDYGRVYKTYDGGNNWLEINPTAPYGYEYVNDLQFLNDSIGYICLQSTGNATIRKTRNLGSTWTIAWNAEYNGEMFNKIFFIDERVGYASRYEKLYKTTDSAKTWVEQWGTSSNGINSIWFIDSSTGYVAGNNGLLKKTIDGGSIWTNVMITPSYYEDLYNVRFLNSSLGYLTTKSGAIYKSTDGGLNWVLDAKSFSFPVTSLKFGKDSSVYIAGQNGGIIRSGTKPVSSNPCPTAYWTGNAGTAWENTGNWSCGVLPGPNTSVVIPYGSAVVINSNVQVRSLQIDPIASLGIGAYYVLRVIN